MCSTIHSKEKKSHITDYSEDSQLSEIKDYFCHFKQKPFTHIKLLQTELEY